jgi:Zn-dependent protease with chaperone function
MQIMSSLGKIKRAMAIAVAVLFLVTPTAALSQTKVKPGFNLFSAQQDIEIGRESSVEAEKELPVLSDARAMDYINRLGQALAALAPGERYPYSFKIVNASDINAFALPGGPIYINRGTIEAAQNEGELAAVISHEIAHVALRHGTNQASKAYLAQAGLGVLGGILGQGKASTIIGAVGGFGLNTLFLKYSRDAETQADVIGAQIMASAGYDPLDMARFFETLQRESQSNPSKLERFFSDHPSPPDRAQRIEREAAMIGFRGRGRGIGDLDEIRSGLMGLPKAPTLAEIQRRQPPSGSDKSRPRNISSPTVVRLGPPSSTFRVYRQPGGMYEIAYPENWRAYPDNHNLGVSFVPEGGAVEVDGRAEIVYGAIVNYYRPISDSRNASDRNLRGGAKGQQRRSLSEATNDLVANILQSHPYLRAAKGSASQAQLAGRNGLTVTLTGRSPVYNRGERVTIYTRAMNDEDIFYVLFITPNDDYLKYRGAYERMLKSLTIRENEN